MFLFFTLIFATTYFHNDLIYAQPQPIKKLILNGTTYFYYPVTLHNNGFKTGVVYKNFLGCSQDMLLTNGSELNYYMQSSMQSLQMVFYYAVPETLFNFSSNLYCHHNKDPNQIITQVDPLMNLDSIPSSFCQMSYCELCKQYYFYTEKENNSENTLASKEQNKIPKGDLSSTKIMDETEACSNLKLKNQSISDETQTLPLAQETQSVEKIEDKAKRDSFDAKDSIPKENESSLKPLVLTYLEVAQISTSTRNNTCISPQDKILPKVNNESKTPKNKGIIQRSRNFNAKHPSTNKKTVTQNRNYSIKEQTTTKTVKQKQDKKYYMKCVQNKDKNTPSSSPKINPNEKYKAISLTNKYNILAKDIEEVEEEDKKDSDNETGYCTTTETLSTISEFEIAHENKPKLKKSAKNKTRKKNRKIDEEEFCRATEDDIEEISQELLQNTLSNENIDAFYSDKVHNLTYKFKSTRMIYLNIDLQYLKAIIFTKYYHLFTDYEKYFYHYRQFREEKLKTADINTLNKHKEEELIKYKKLLKKDCDSHIFFYNSDNKFFNADFMLLSDFLRKLSNENDTFSTNFDTNNKFVNRYELTKDRFIVFLFYFLQRLELRVLSEPFLKEFISFFFNFQNNKEILNSSKKYIDLIFCITVDNVSIEECEKFNNGSNPEENGNGCLKIFTKLMNILPEFIKKYGLNLRTFIIFLKCHLRVTSIDERAISKILKREDEFDNKLILEGRKRSNYFC